MNKDVTIFAKTNFRNQEVEFGIKTDDRRRHMYIIGKTGMGKTIMLENMIIDDFKQGRGLALIDPHGDMSSRLLEFIPKERIKDVIYFDASDTDNPIAFNPLESISEKHHHLITIGIVEIFRKLWADIWNSRIEYIFNNCLFALLEYSNSTLLEVMRLLTDENFRKNVAIKLKDPIIRNFWTTEFEEYSKKYQTEVILPIQNKIGQFISNPIIRNIIGQKKSSFNLRELMDEGKILIVNISRGKIGESSSAILGSLLITKIQQTALSRADITEEERNDFFLYVDEFQTFATDSFETILSEARKYRLSLILSHQYISQLSQKIRNAIFGNVGTFVIFRVGAEDAEFLEKEFKPEFVASDIINLSKYNTYIKLMIDGRASKAFSASTLPPPQIPEDSDLGKMIIKNVREKYTKTREQIEEQIAGEWDKGADSLFDDRLKQYSKIISEKKREIEEEIPEEEEEKKEEEEKEIEEDEEDEGIIPFEF
jgi:hypothetical protein